MKIPTPLEKSPQLSLLVDQQREINSKITELTAEAQGVRARLNAKQPDGGNVEANSLQRLLGKKVGPDILPDAERLPRLLTELDRLKVAQQSLYSAVRAETAAASRLVCEHVQPEHGRLAKQFATKILELHKAHTEYVEFCDAVENTGAQTSALGLVQPLAFHPRDPSSAYFYAMKSFREAGFVERNQIPETIR